MRSRSDLFWSYWNMEMWLADEDRSFRQYFDRFSSHPRSEHYSRFSFRMLAAVRTTLVGWVQLIRDGARLQTSYFSI